MFALIPVSLLLFVTYIRPQELVPALARPSPLHVCIGLCFLGLVIDLWRRHIWLRPSPQFYWVMAVFVWSIAGLAVMQPSRLSAEAVPYATSIIMFVVIGQGLNTVKAIQWTARLLLVIGLFLSVLGVHQGLSDRGCFTLNWSEAPPYRFDGRLCESRLDCQTGDIEPGAEYVCERAGMLETATIEDRVRYRGILEDPNELALAVAVSLPFAFAFYQLHRSLATLLLLVATSIVTGICIIYTQSRGGQIVFLAVIGTFLLKQIGVARGLIVGALLALPIMLLGGRSSGAADESAMERLEAWRVGIEVLVASPLFGVGKGLFIEHHIRTTHNSYVLVAAETGLAGFLMWSIVMYLSVKTTVLAIRHCERLPGPEGDAMRIWANALLASLAGTFCGIMFLSLSYHPVIWAYVGLTAAISGAMRRHVPDWKVPLSRREVAFIAGGNLAFLIAVYLYARYKGA